MGAIGHDMMKRLLLHDQLGVQMAAGNVFQGFKESEINFRPTYKFDPDSEQYYTPLSKCYYILIVLYIYIY